MNLHIINQTKKNVSKVFLSKWVRALSKELPLKHKKKLTDLTLIFVTKSQSKKLNKTYRNKNYATDVLSFGSYDSMPELVLCIDIIRQQAREHSLSFNHELGYLVLHGILHLLGYEHEKTKAGSKKMFRIQDSIFEKLTS